MYHSRTKKVASYGRRAQRVVAVSDDRRFSSDAFSLSGRDNLNSDGASHHYQKSDAAEDIFSLPCKLVPCKQAEAESKPPRHSGAVLSPRRKLAGKKAPAKEARIRKPLGSYQANVPNSPAVSPKVHKVRAGNGKSTPHELRKMSTISPYVDVDIVVFDEKGHQLNEERRVTKMNVQVNDIDSGVAKPVRRARRPTSMKSYAIFASEDEDEDEDDEEYIPESKFWKKEFGKRKTEEPALEPNSHKSGKPVGRERHTELEEPPLDHSDSELPRMSKTSKRAISTIVISDSESERDAEDTLETTHSRRGVTGGHSNERRQNTQAVKRSMKTSAVSIPVSSSSRHSNRDLKNSLASSRVAKKPQAAVQSSRTRKPPLRGAQERNLAVDLIPPSEAHISAESNASLQHLRQVTPIKPSRSKAAFLHQRPGRLSPSRAIVLSDDEESFSVDKELELALQVADIQLANSLRPPKSSTDKPCTSGSVTTKLGSNQRRSTVSRAGAQRPKIPSFLRPLLSECGQLTTFDFTSFIETFPADPIIGYSGHTSVLDNSTNAVPFDSFQKVGEASYSEVFGIGTVVLKIVPLLDEENDASATWTADWDSPPVSEAQDVVKEIVVTRAMGEICKGFIKLLKVHVVQGSYPEPLLALWDKYDAIRGSESVRPDHFTTKQTYAVIILPNGGPDLENFSFNSFNVMGGTGWRQACSIFWQVVRSLGHAEELVHFEHRDLHWGQILVRHTMKPSRLLARVSLKKTTMDDPWHGVQSTIIDLGLARIDQGQGNSFWTPFTEEIFEGEGEYQYDIYRMMRKHNKDEWQSFRPLSNVMWLHYLADKLIHYKHLRVPRTHSQARRNSMSADTKLVIMDADRRAYECLTEIEQVLWLSIVSIARAAGVKPRKRSNESKGFSTSDVDRINGEVKSAAEVLRFGKEKGWIV